MDDEVRTKLERSLQYWRPGVVTRANGAGAADDFRNCGKIDHLEKWIGRRFHPSQFGGWAQRFFHCGEVAHVNEIGRESPAEENFAQQARRAVVSVDMREDVIARRERL